MTGALLRGRELVGHPVVEIATGDDVAEVKDVVFDAGRGSITGFTLRRRGFLGRKLRDVLPVEGVHSVGTHAVMIQTADALASPDDAPDSVTERADRDVLHDAVITESGRTLGQVRDVIVQGGAQPRVVGFEISGGPVGDGLVPLGAQTGVSGSALIVPDGFEQRIRTDMTGFAAELAVLQGGADGARS